MHVYDLCRICLTEDINTSKMQPLFETDDDTCNDIVQRIEVCGGIVVRIMLCYLVLLHGNI